MESDLLKGHPFKALMIFTVPFMVSTLLQSLYGSVDLFVVGQFGQTFDVSGVSIGSQAMMTVTNFVLGVATGLTVMLGNYVGSDEHRKISKTIGAGIILSAICSIILTIVLVMGNHQIVSWMNTPKEAIHKQRENIYMFVLLGQYLLLVIMLLLRY